MLDLVIDKSRLLRCLKVRVFTFIMINNFDFGAQTPSTLLVNVLYRRSRHLWAAKPLNDAVSELSDLSGNMVLILHERERLIFLVKERGLVLMSLFSLQKP